MSDLAVTLYVVHSRRACPDRSHWCDTLSASVASQLDQAGIDCQLTVTDPEELRPPTRTGAHMHILHEAAKAEATGRVLAVMEDDTITHVDMGKVVRAFAESTDELWYLTEAATAYLLKPDAARRLVSHASGLQNVGEYRDVVSTGAKTLCLRRRTLVSTCSDGSSSGRVVPSLRANKACGLESEASTLIEAAALWKSSPHPYRALAYARMLAASGDVCEAHSVCSAALQTFERSPDVRGDTDLVTFAVRLFEGKPVALSSSIFPRHTLT